MALTLAKVAGRPTDFKDGDKSRKVRTVTFDSSYLTAGESLTAADVGLRVITEVIPHGAFRNTGGTLGITVSYDYANSKLLAYWSNSTTAALPEVTSTTNLSTYSGRLTILGY